MILSQHSSPSYPKPKSPFSHSLGQCVQGRGVDLPPDIDVDGRRVPGGGGHHGDALPHPRLPLDVGHTGHYPDTGSL